jgi:hypothetical protein
MSRSSRSESDERADRAAPQTHFFFSLKFLFIFILLPSYVNVEKKFLDQETKEKRKTKKKKIRSCFSIERGWQTR